MLGVITKLQRKSERARRRIAFIGAGVVTGVIVILWLVNFTLEEPLVASGPEETRPFRALADGVGALLADTREALREATEIFSFPVPSPVPEPATPVPNATD